jgi:hypothetical protein
MYNHYSDERFNMSFRMPKGAFDELYALVEPIYYASVMRGREEGPARRGRGRTREIDVKLLFAAGISMLAFNKRYSELEETFGVSAAWLCEQTPAMLTAIICAIQSDHRAAIQFPSTELEWETEKQGWLRNKDPRYALFYGAVGAVDGSLIRLEARTSGRNDQDERAHKRIWCVACSFAAKKLLTFPSGATARGGCLRTC